MTALPNVAKLPPKVMSELAEVEIRVTQGIPAFQALRNVLSDREWLQIKEEVEQYFPPAAGSARKQRKVQAPPRPPYYAIRTLMTLRNISQPRAILELGLATDMLSDAAYRRLMREIGESQSTQQTKPTKRPVWDPTSNTLRFGKSVLIKFISAKRAKNQVAILEAFERRCWTCSIPTPLHEGQKTHDAVYALNSRQQRIHFRVEHDGAWIVWSGR